MRATEATGRRWLVGELAAATGLTVRTLHHYDAIGLLAPSGRTESGYRLYDEADVRRLYRVLALRRLGLSLEEVAAWLDREGADPREAVVRHLREVERELAAKERLRRLLVRILDELDREVEPSVDRFVEAIEVMTMHERYYTPDQVEQLERRRRELGDEAIERVEAEWAELIAKLEVERARGTDPADERVQSLARRWRELIAEFTGGDPGIWQSLRRMYEEEGAEKASRGMVSSELAAYVARAAEAGR
jgi:DNA-binding transcriptional MerR regulator